MARRRSQGRGQNVSNPGAIEKHLFKVEGMNNPAEYQEFMRDDLSELSASNVLIGGLVRTSPGFPLETCGNDGLRQKLILRRKLQGIQSAEIKQRGEQM